jgi:KaiC/GvpD/RAD55 family RecA-like ATPase
MAKTIYIDLELEKKKIIKQMKDLEKDLAQSIKRTEKNAKFNVELDEKGLKKSTDKASTDIINTIKKVSNKKARIILDSANFKSELDKIELVARDTGKKLDKALLTKLEVKAS